MKLLTKIRAIGLIGICLVFYYPRLSNRVRFDQVAELNTTEDQVVYARSSLQSNDYLEFSVAPKIIEDTIRQTKKVSMFPVGLVTKLGVSSPIVKDGKFVGFYDGWIHRRKFPVDMAGFAVNVEFLLKRRNATMPYPNGTHEDGFLKSLAPFEPSEIELLADNCTRILVWHTQMKENGPSAPLNMKLHNSTNLILLKQQLI